MHVAGHPMHAHIFFYIIETTWIFSYIIIYDPPKHSNTLDVENFLMGLSFQNVRFHLKSQITNIKQNCLPKYSFACMISNLVEWGLIYIAFVTTLAYKSVKHSWFYNRIWFRHFASNNDKTFKKHPIRFRVCILYAMVSFKIVSILLKTLKYCNINIMFQVTNM